MIIDPELDADDLDDALRAADAQAEDGLQAALQQAEALLAAHAWRR